MAKKAAAKTDKKKSAKPVAKKIARSVKRAEKKIAKSAKPAAKKSRKTAVKASFGFAEPETPARILSSKEVFSGPLFCVQRETIVEPGGKENTRDIVRHNSSAVILAIDNSKDKKDPWIVMERQFRHAANRFLWELPAGKLEAGEDPLAGAQRELEEETGYRAKKWTPLLAYFPSPGFLGESMRVYLAEGLIPGAAHPEDDEQIEIRLVKFSELLKMIDKGGIIDGKTLSCALYFARKLASRRRK